MKKLDLKIMKKGAKKLVGTKDFSTFRASSCKAKSPIKTMKSVKIRCSKRIGDALEGLEPKEARKVFKKCLKELENRGLVRD